MALATFGGVKLLTDKGIPDLPEGIECEIIPPLGSASAYSEFVLRRLADYVDTSHCLLVQWDGHVLDPDRWKPKFLTYDYIGASWPQFPEGNDVGNGGFSLRSRALLKACQRPEFVVSHPEDLAICQSNRSWLEAQGIRLAPRKLADSFSAERSGDPTSTFGYHGVWHMPRVLGTNTFWEIYCGLDDRSTLRHDFRSLLWQMVSGLAAPTRVVKMISDRLTESRSKEGTEL
jgi:hypothetical protein